MATIEALEQRLKELETKVNKLMGSMNLGNRVSCAIGSPSSELILRNNGKVRIQWGSNFIDLIKNGKINPELVDYGVGLH